MKSIVRYIHVEHPPVANKAWRNQNVPSQCIMKSERL